MKRSMLIFLAFWVSFALGAQSGSWAPVAGQWKDLAFSPQGKLFAISAPEGNVLQYHSDTDSWELLPASPSGVRDIAVDNYGRPWIVANRQAFYLDRDTWREAPGPTLSLGSGHSGSIYKVSSGSNEVFRWNDKRKLWDAFTRSPANAKLVLGSNADNFLYSTEKDELVFWVNGRPIRTNQRAICITSGHRENSTYLIDPTGQLRQYRDAQDQWKTIDKTPADLQQAAVNPVNQQVWMLDRNGILWQPLDQCILNGKIVAPDGRAIPDVKLTILPIGAAGEQKTEVTTDSRGVWTYETRATSVIVSPKDFADFNPKNQSRRTNGITENRKGYILQLESNTYYTGLNFVTKSTELANEKLKGSFFDVTQERPKLIVLIHGITASQAVDAERKEKWRQDLSNGKPKSIKTKLLYGFEQINTPAHMQFYWGYDFIRVMLSKEGSDDLYFYQPQDRENHQKFTQREWDDHSKPVYPPRDWPRSPIAPLIFDGDMLHLSDVPKTSVMVLYRDGAQPFMEQTEAAVAQLYSSYQQYFGHLPVDQQPGIHLVGHSFGGIVSRAILTNSRSVLPGKRHFIKEFWEKADYIRDRTIWLNTLSTPHQGSPVPRSTQRKHQAMQELASYIRDLGNLDRYLQTNRPRREDFRDEDFDIIMDNLANLAEKLKFEEERENLATLIEEIARHILTGDRPVLDDINNTESLQSNFFQEQHLRRTDGSHVPVYTMTGSNPGYLYHLAQRPIMFSGEGPIYNRHALLDLIRHYDNLGDRKIALESTVLALLEMIAEASDWTRQYANFKAGDRFSTATSGMINTLLLGLHPTRGLNITERPDGYFDTDGMVGFESGHNLHPSAARSAPFDHQQRWPLSGQQVQGSWYRLFGAEYGVAHPWDYDNHRSICFNTGTAAFIHHYLLQRAGPLPAPGQWSSFDGNKSEAQTQTSAVTVEINRVTDLRGDLDPGPDDADFTGAVKFGNRSWQASNPIQGVNDAYKDQFQTGKQYLWTFGSGWIPNATIIPVIIRIKDDDSGLYLTDDLCSANPAYGREDIVLFVDTQNGKFYGDLEGEVNRPVPYELTGHPEDHHRVRVQFRIRVKQK